MRRCESKRKRFKTRRGKVVTFTASVGETCKPAWSRPSERQKKWRRNFTRAAKLCPAKPGPSRTSCMARQLDLKRPESAARAGMAGHRRRRRHG